MSLQIEQPEKEKSSSPPPSSPSFSLLPNDITVSYLARIPRSYYPRLSTVSKTFKSLLSSTDLYAARSHLGNTEQCLYICIWEYSSLIPQWFRLWINPNQTLPNSSLSTKKTIRPVFVPIPNLNSTTLSVSSVAVVGSEIYVMGGMVDQSLSSRVRVLDCRSDTWRDAPNMNNVRRGASSCVYGGKIYVLGGCKRLDEWAEVFDTKTQTWECLPDPGNEICKCIITRITEMEGKIKFEDWITKKRYAYDTKQGKWVRCDEKASVSFPTTECVIENVSYRFFYSRQAVCQWYDMKDGKWKDVEGLDLLRQKYIRTDGSSVYTATKLASCGGKLLALWEQGKRHAPNGMKKIWCAEIMVEKRDGGEVWGNVEWVDLVHTAPPSWHLSHCLPVSV